MLYFNINFIYLFSF